MVLFGVSLHCPRSLVSLFSLRSVRNLADTFNGHMIIPNLIDILLLSGEVVKLKKEYFEEKSAK
ncbi:MAG: alanine:cation symporter family protein [Oscillospiraceae bacterium]|nr:alanine:cation symporter family protein [Oscillospiraceae bacterium]